MQSLSDNLKYFRKSSKLQQPRYSAEYTLALGEYCEENYIEVCIEIHIVIACFKHYNSSLEIEYSLML